MSQLCQPRPAQHQIRHFRALYRGSVASPSNPVKPNLFVGGHALSTANDGTNPPSSDNKPLTRRRSLFFRFVTWVQPGTDRSGAGGRSRGHV